MLSDSGGWIYNFAVTDTQTHKSGYTIYKITSIVFPRHLPQTLNCLVVWRRFHEVKRLYRELKNRHKSHQLPGQVPQPSSCNYFKRFDEEAIEKRKKYILNLLNFAAKYPELYKCYSFNQFLYDCAQSTDSSLSKDQDQAGDEEEEKTIISKDLVMIKSSSTLDSHQGIVEISRNDKDEEKMIVDWTSDSVKGNISNDMVYKAALEFSTAVQAEVNQDYEKAYEAYRRGIVELEKCSDCCLYKDTSKSILKAKIDDYSRRADKMKNQIHLQARKLLMEISSIDEFERPIQELSHYKVIGLLHDKLMIVSPINPDNQLEQYIVKCIHKSFGDDHIPSIRLPRNILYMINFSCYFQNEYKYFVLLPLVTTGRLKDILYNGREGSRPALLLQHQQESNHPAIESNDNALILSSTNEFETIIQSSKELLKSVTRTIENLKTLEDTQCSPPVENDGIPDEQRKQWARELLLAINSLHENGIILRDLQTDNLLLGEDNRLLLSFFYGNNNDLDTLENCEECRISCQALHGHYVAPERPLTFKSDWWSYGIVLYELMMGIPFKSTHPGRMDLYGCVQYPEQINAFFLSANICDLINNLLQPIPEERFDYAAIRNHSFFEGTDWNSVWEKGKSHF